MRPYSPGGALNALASARGVGPPTPSAHRLRLGLPGYLILFAPLAFAPQRQSWPRRPPSPPVFFQISAHSTATLGIPPSPTRLKPAGIGSGRGLRSLRDLTQHLTTRADDSHAPPVWAPLGHGVSPASPICQALVRFFALLRIKPHAPLLVRAPVNSFEF